jgi:hypothetical protein
MSSHGVDSPKDGLLSRRDSEVLAAGGSPRRRWSPRLSPRLSPSSLRRRHQYEQLKISPKTSLEAEAEEEANNYLKENTSPLAELSMNSGTSMPYPKLSSGARRVLESPSSAAHLSMPSPGPRPRFSLSALRPFSLSMGSGGSKPQRSTNNSDTYKEEGSKAHAPSPIFRFNVQSFADGTEAVLPEGTVEETDRGSSNDPLDRDKKEQDDFDNLVKERKGSIGATTAVNNPCAVPAKDRQGAIGTSTDLHEICSTISTLDDVLRAKAFLIGSKTENGCIVNSASKTDYKGRTPLHVFSYNKVLAAAIGIPNEFDGESREYLRIYDQPSFDPESNLEKHVIRFLNGDLLAAYPGAMMIIDDDGHIPFEGGLIEWVNVCHNRGITSEAAVPNYPSNFASYTSAMTQVWESTSTAVRSARKSVMLASGLNGGSPRKSPINSRDVERGDSNRTSIFSPDRRQAFDHTGEEPVKTKDHLKDRAFPSFVRLTPQARFIFMMLSAVVDQLDHYMSPDLGSRSPRTSRERGYDTLNKESFERAQQELRRFRETYGSVNITSMVVQTSKSVVDFKTRVRLYGLLTCIRSL